MDGHQFYPRHDEPDICGDCGTGIESHNVVPPQPQSPEVTAQLSAALQKFAEIEKIAREDGHD